MNDNPWYFYETLNSCQSFTSKKTARCQIPKSIKIIRNLNFQKNQKLLDIGCGSSNFLYKKEVESIGLKYYGCDPFNKLQSENLKSISACNNGNAHIVTLNNVLNTIKEKNIWIEILNQAKMAVNKDNGKVLILTYEGAKLSEELKKEIETGKKMKKLMPTETRDGWQNRMKTEEYLPYVNEVFPEARIYRNNGVKIIIVDYN